MKKLTEIRRLLKKTQSANKPLAMKLVIEAEYMEDVLQRLKAEMESAERQEIKGSVLHSYNSTMRNYQSTIKMLNEMLPTHIEEAKDDEFEL